MVGPRQALRPASPGHQPGNHRAGAQGSQGEPERLAVGGSVDAARPQLGAASHLRLLAVQPALQPVQGIVSS